jgi:hypothetical protein
VSALGCQSSSLHEVTVHAAFTIGGPSSADDPHGISVALGPDDENQSSFDRADGDEAILDVGVRLIEDLEIVCSRLEEIGSLFERDAVLPSVLPILLGISQTTFTLAGYVIGLVSQ